MCILLSLCVLFSSIIEYSIGTVQACSGLHHLGIQAHDEECGRHGTRHPVRAATEHRPGGERSTELLPDVLHRHPAAPVLGRHRQLAHCR